jgi:predicted negative regulator of RcsB-dependent stress response
MRISCLLVGVAFSLALLCSVTAHAETAEQAFVRGNTLLAKGSFQEALQAYSTAVRAERTNQQYGQQFMLVRRVIALRESLDREKDTQRWLKIAQSLRSFYISQGIYSEALSVDEGIHSRLNTALSAGQLAETQLAMGRDAEASRVLSSLAPEKVTTATQALLGIAIARQGQVDEARSISEAIATSDSSDPGTQYVLARLQAVVGNHGTALGLLTRCFEAVPPSRLNDLKMHAKLTPELAALASTDGFAAALQTESKVAESKCSGGSSCAGCPMRGNCAKSQDK